MPEIPLCSVAIHGVSGYGLLTLGVRDTILIKFLSQNSDVFLGWTGWSAGAFNPQTYELSEVPTKNGNSWADTSLVKACMKKA